MLPPDLSHTVPLTLQPFCLCRSQSYSPSPPPPPHRSGAAAPADALGLAYLARVLDRRAAAERARAAAAERRAAAEARRAAAERVAAELCRDGDTASCAGMRPALSPLCICKSLSLSLSCPEIKSRRQVGQRTGSPAGPPRVGHREWAITKSARRGLAAVAHFR